MPTSKTKARSDSIQTWAKKVVHWSARVSADGSPFTMAAANETRKIVATAATTNARLTRNESNSEIAARKWPC
jgi:hypothetical protein